LGIVGAAAAGVVIGMLVSPDKAKQICNKLTSTVTDWAGDLKDSITKTVSGVEEQVNEATA